MKTLSINKPSRSTATETFTLRMTLEDKELFQQVAKELKVSVATLLIEVTKQKINENNTGELQ